ncbi:inositol monophosphatase [candidate division KSB1 bacterium]|nr:MAG: inositol monophosphatase [candidate division KSB1 bacterium]
METEKEKFLEVAFYAAEEAGKILMKNYGKKTKITLKGEINIVTDVDIKSEKSIINIIKREYPSHNFLSEESTSEKVESEYLWIIDPLDGTTNYSHAYPHFCVSIALAISSKVEIGVVFDPVRKERFHSVRGKGAFLNGRLIKPSQNSSLNSSLIATGFPYDLREDSKNNIAIHDHLLLRALAVRRSGSAALDLCYVASGRLDGFWELKLSPWDVAAGGLIIEEAGGKITDFSDRAYSIYTSEILATNSLIHEEMRLEIISAYDKFTYE